MEQTVYLLQWWMRFAIKAIQLQLYIAYISAYRLTSSVSNQQHTVALLTS